MSRQQYEQMLSNPNVRKMLDLIAKTEGVAHGYNTLFGNQRIENLSAHPNIRKQFTRKDGKIEYTTAAGRYQFIIPTWRNLAKQLGLSDFSPRSQDIGAVALLAQNGALPYVLKGDYLNAVKRSGSTWASLPSAPERYSQPKRGWDFVNQSLGSQTPQAQQKQYQPELASAQDTLRLKGNTGMLQPTSAEETLRMKGGYAPELASAQETIRLKGG
ncbi:glycoside hydrolase family 104 protein [Acinetobacter haemolyticus]|uniref:glycoside hydrolase family 24 protein n=1 Tax=Acinetobacter haemolyticus TaxID=29430 RepID=UPI0012985E07|nr:glycoside hydrolase family 104 protein [Acinetobacter haemolyticus]MQZ31934.1 glycoside hydrolase family 104 protein [Acinetobacter haemolyticus]